MSANSNSGQPIQGNNNVQGSPAQRFTPESMQQMAYKFTQCFNEAKRIGLQTPQGQELLKQASFTYQGCI